MPSFFGRRKSKNRVIADPPDGADAVDAPPESPQHLKEASSKKRTPSIFGRGRTSQQHQRQKDESLASVRSSRSTPASSKKHASSSTSNRGSYTSVFRSSSTGQSIASAEKREVDNGKCLTNVESQSVRGTRSVGAPDAKMDTRIRMSNSRKEHSEPAFRSASVRSARSVGAPDTGSLPSGRKSRLGSVKKSKRSHMRRSSYGSEINRPVSAETTHSQRRYRSPRKNSIARAKGGSVRSTLSMDDSRSGVTRQSDEYYDTPEFRNRVAQEAANLDKDGNSLFEKGNYDEAFLCYERALKLKRATLQSSDQIPEDTINETDEQKASILASVATSINNMTYLRQRAGQATADETMAAYLKSLQIKREILGPNHLSVGKTLNNIGSVFYLKKEFVPALKAYENANEIMAESLGGDHLDVGTVLSNIGDVHAAMRHRKEALHYYKMALDIRWAKLGRADPKVIRLMEQAAMLETGRQPYKRAEELSESEDEEFAAEDRKRQAEFKEECQALQEELVEDIKFFDLVERTIAIEMVKQKTKFMRAMRKLSGGDAPQGGSTEQVAVNEHKSNDPEGMVEIPVLDMGDGDQESDSDSRLSVMSAPPNLDYDSCDNSALQEAPEVQAFLQEIGAGPKYPRPLTTHTTPARKSIARNDNPQTPPTETSTPPSTPPLSAGNRRFQDSANNRLPKPSGGETPTRLTTDMKLRKPVLTQEERKQALIHTKERLQTLKSRRSLEGDLEPTEERRAARAARRARLESKRRLYAEASNQKSGVTHPVK